METKGIFNNIAYDLAVYRNLTYGEPLEKLESHRLKLIEYVKTIWSWDFYRARIAKNDLFAAADDMTYMMYQRTIDWHNIRSY